MTFLTQLSWATSSSDLFITFNFIFLLIEAFNEKFKMLHCVYLSCVSFCLYLYVWARHYDNIHVRVRGQLPGIGSHIPPCGFPRLKLDPQVWQQAPLPNKPPFLSFLMHTYWNYVFNHAFFFVLCYEFFVASSFHANISMHAAGAQYIAVGNALISITEVMKYFWNISSTLFRWLFWMQIVFPLLSYCCVLSAWHGWSTQ